MQTLGLDVTNPEHAFFADCCLKLPADPSFCKDGILDSNSSVVSLPPGEAFSPRASIIRKILKKRRHIFLTQKGSPIVSSIGNKHLNLKTGGGLSPEDRLPASVHILLCCMINGPQFRNPGVPMPASQVLVYLQNGLASLDDTLLKYKSPIYNACPFRICTYQNGRREVLKNTAHPTYEKWDSLLKRLFFDNSYLTTRVTFLGTDFTLQKITSQLDKNAFFSFVYTTDLILGALPSGLFP
jgi:hypothetical protein